MHEKKIIFHLTVSTNDPFRIPFFFSSQSLGMQENGIDAWKNLMKEKICTFYFLSENKGVMIVMQYIVRFFIENFCLSGVIGSIHCFFSQVDNYFPFFAPYLPSPVHCSSFVNILINRKNIRFPSPIHF